MFANQQLHSIQLIINDNITKLDLSNLDEQLITLIMLKSKGLFDLAIIQLLCEYAQQGKFNVDVELNISQLVALKFNDIESLCQICNIPIHIFFSCLVELFRSRYKICNPKIIHYRLHDNIIVFEHEHNTNIITTTTGLEYELLFDKETQFFYIEFGAFRVYEHDYVLSYGLLIHVTINDLEGIKSMGDNMFNNVIKYNINHDVFTKCKKIFENNPNLAIEILKKYEVY